MKKVGLEYIETGNGNQSERAHTQFVFMVLEYTDTVDKYQTTHAQWVFMVQE